MQRSMLGNVDLSYHQYPYRLLFPGRYSDVPLYRLITALMADVFRNPSELVVLPGYDTHRILGDAHGMYFTAPQARSVVRFNCL